MHGFTTAAALAAAFSLLGCAAQRGDQAFRNYTPPPPVRQSPQPGERSVEASLQIGSSIAEPPERTPTWERKHDAPRGVLLVTSGRVVASLGDAVIARDGRTGNTLWVRHDVSEPLESRDGFFFLRQRERIAALNAANGGTVWNRRPCAPPQHLYTFTVGERFITALCSDSADRAENAIPVVFPKSGAGALRKVTGPFQAMHGVELRAVTPKVTLVRAFFDGAWSGVNGYVIDGERATIQHAPMAPQPISPHAAQRYLAVDGAPLLELKTYAPLDMVEISSTGSLSDAVRYAPDPQRFAPTEEQIVHGDGYARVAGSWVYIAIGPALYRYRLHVPPQEQHPQRLLNSISGPVIFTRDIAVTQVRLTDGSDTLGVVTRLAQSPVLHLLSQRARALAEIAEPYGPTRHAGTQITGEPRFVTIPIDGKAYVIDARTGNAVFASKGCIRNLGATQGYGDNGYVAFACSLYPDHKHANTVGFAL